MSADSRSCTGDLITTDEAEKLVVGKDGSIMGVAGDRGACVLVREWFEKGADMGTIPKLHPGSEPGGPFDALVLRPDGRVESLDHHFAFMPRSAPAAIGTGGEIAVGAMRAGKSPAEAVSIAAECVASVGGEIRTERPKKKSA